MYIYKHIYIHTDLPASIHTYGGVTSKRIANVYNLEISVDISNDYKLCFSTQTADLKNELTNTRYWLCNGA